MASELSITAKHKGRGGTEKGVDEEDVGSHREETEGPGQNGHPHRVLKGAHNALTTREHQD